MSSGLLRVGDAQSFTYLAVIVFTLCAAGEAAYGLEFISATLDKSTGVLAVTFDADVSPDSVDATKFHIREQGSATGGIALTGSAATTNGTQAFLALTDAHKTMLEEIDRPRLAIDRAAITDSTGDPFDATFDISTAFFLDSTSVHVADTGSDGLEFNNDGTRMFIGDYANPVREYALSVAFDASTASFLGNSDELSDSVGYFAFNSNGSRLFVSLNDGLIGQYDMPAPFDISNLTFAGSLDVSENDSFLYDIFFGADGNNLFVTGGDNGQIYQYRLPTPFDLSGASHVASLELQEGAPMSLVFGSGGTRMIVLNDKDEIFQYVVPVAFNLTGVRYDDTSFDLLNSENGNLTSSYGLAFSNDGTKMFVVDSPDHFTVAEYILGTFEVGVTNDPAPQLLSIEGAGPVDMTTNRLTLVFNVTFNEPVENVDAGDFALSPDSTGSTSGRFTQTSTPALAIPDNATAVSDTITVPRAGTATAVSVAVDITHTYIRDLKAELVAPDGLARTLHVDLGSSANGPDWVHVPDFGGAGVAGDWILRVSDRAGGDTGTLNSWTLTIDHDGADNPVTGLTGSGDTYLVTVSAAQDGTYNLDVTQDNDIADTADNPLSSPTPTGADHTYTVDTTAPTVTSIERSDPAGETTSAQTMVFAVTFSEDVVGVDVGDFALSPGSSGSTSGRFTQTSTPALAIPDNAPAVSDTITVPRAGTATAVSVAVDITHTYIGDLKVELVAPDGTAQALHSHTGGPANDIDRTYTPDFDGTGIAGDWTLRVRDDAGADTGTLHGWALTIDHGGADSPVTGLTGSGDTYLVTVSVTRDGTYNLDITQDSGIADAADNPLADTDPTGADHTYAVSTVSADTAAPTVTSIARSDPAGATTSERTLVFEVTFSEDVAGVDAGDFALSPGSTGSASASGRFTQASTPALAIPDNAPAVSDTITVPRAGTATAVSVAVDITHTFIGDLKVELVAPDGTAQALHSHTGGPANDIDRTYTPDFDGTGIAGDWTLRVRDDVEADTGTLHGWALTIDHGGSGSPVTGLTGSGDTYLVTVSATRDGTYNLDVTQDSGIADAADNPLADTDPTGADHTYAVSTVSADTTAPTVTSIERSDPADQATSAQTLVFAVTFSEDVAGVDAGDFALSPGSTGAGSIAGLTGSGSQYLVNVSATRDGTYNLDVTQDSGIADAADNPLADTDPTGADHTYAVSTVSADTTAPTVTSIERSDPADQATSAQTLVFAVTFSEDVAGVDAGDFALSPGSTGAGSIAGLTGSGSQYLVNVSATRDGTYNLDVTQDSGIADAADNPLADTDPTGADHTYAVSTVSADTTAPTVTSIERSDPADQATSAQTLVFAVTFSEDVAGVDAGDFALSPGSTGAGSIAGLTGSGSQYLVNVSATRDGTYNLDVTQDSGIADAADNPLADTDPTGADHTYAVSTVSADTTAPTVTSIERSDPADQATSAQTLVFAVTFSEDVAGVDAGDFALSPDSTGAGSIAGLTGSGSQYLVNVSATRDGTYNLGITQDSGIADAADNPLSSPTPTGADHTYAVSTVSADTTAPTVTSIERSDPADQATSAQTLVFAVTFSEDVAGVDAGDFALSPGSTGAGSIAGLTGSGSQYLVNVSATRDGTYNLDVTQDSGIADAADNPLSSPTPTGADHTYAVSTVSADTTAPTVTSIERSDPADQATSAQTLVFAVTFSEDVAGVDAGDFALSPGSTGAGSIAGLTGSGSQYLVNVSATRDGTYNLDVTQDSGIADAADNPLSSPTPTGADHTYAVDTTAPTVTSIARSDPAEAATSERTLIFEVTFSEDVAGVDADDFALSPGGTGSDGGPGQFTQTSTPALAIPDNAPAVSDTITIPDSGTATAVSVAVDITHTFIDDLVVELVAPDGTAQALHSHTGGPANDIDRTYTPDFGGAGIAGDWTLRVRDDAEADTGTLNSWTLTIDHGGAGSPVTGLTGSGSQYLVNVSAAQDGTYNLDLVSSGHGITDAADNPLSSPTPTGADHTYAVDTTAPTVTSIARSDPAGETTSAQTLVFAVTFSEDVAGVDAGDFALSPDSTGAGSIAGLTGSGSQYLVNVSAAQDGTYNLDLVSSGHGIADAADNPLSSPTPTGADHTYAVDTTAPTVTSIARSDPAGETTSAQTLVFAVTFSEDVAGVDLSDFALSPGSTGSGSAHGRFTQASTPALAIPDNAPAVSDTITVPRAGTATAVSVAVDITHTFIDDLVVELVAPDGTAQALHSHTGGPANDIDRTYTPDFGGAGIAGDWTLRVRDDAEADTGTLNSWTLTIDHGGSGSPVTGLTGSGDTYLVTVSATRDGTYNLDVTQDSGIADAADNPLADTDPTGADHTYAVSTVSADTAAPTVTSIVRSDPADQATSAQTLVFAVTFSEDVTGVDLSDFALSPGSTGSGSASGRFTQASTPALAIPDNAPAVSDTITVPRAGTATAISVAVDITHTYIGDLKVELVAPDGTAQALHSHTGGPANDIDRTYTPDFGGAGIAGDWTLRVRDDAGEDTGTLNSWTLTIDHGGSGSPVTGLTGSGDTYLVTVSATRDGTYNLDITQDSGIADAADNPLSSPTPTGADHAYTKINS